MFPSYVSVFCQSFSFPFLLPSVSFIPSFPCLYPTHLLSLTLLHNDINNNTTNGYDNHNDIHWPILFRFPFAIASSASLKDPNSQVTHQQADTKWKREVTQERRTAQLLRLHPPIRSFLP